MNLNRKYNTTERLYRIAEKLCPPFTIQFSVTGEGKIDANLLKNALEEIKGLSPICKIRLTESGYQFDGEGVKLIQHNGSDYNAQRLNEMPSNDQPIEIHLFNEENTTLIFRVLHRVMDGIGAVIFMKAIFAAYRGDKIEIENSYPCEMDIRRRFQNREKYRLISKKAVYNVPNETSISTQRIDLVGNISNASACVSLAISNIIGEKCRFLIPVSLRRYGSNINSISNLSAPIYLDAWPSETIDEIRKRLLDSLKKREELKIDFHEKLIEFIPNHLLTFFLKKIIHKSTKDRRYAISGFVSDLGYIELNDFSCLGFTALDFVGVPVSTPLTPISVLICNHQNGTRIITTSPIKDLNRRLSKEINELINVNLKNYSNDSFPVNLKLKEIWETHIGLRINPKMYDKSYSDLGGESIKLLFIISDVEKMFTGAQSDLIESVTKLGTTITLRNMSQLVETK